MSHMTVNANSKRVNANSFTEKGHIPLKSGMFSSAHISKDDLSISRRASASEAFFTEEKAQSIQKRNQLHIGNIIHRKKAKQREVDRLQSIAYERSMKLSSGILLLLMKYFYLFISFIIKFSILESRGTLVSSYLFRKILKHIDYFFLYIHLYFFKRAKVQPKYHEQDKQS